MMRKPGVIRLFGGLFFVWLVVACLPWVGAAFNLPTLRFWAVAWLAVWPAGLCFVIWALGSALCWAMERNAKQQAASLAAALGKPATPGLARVTARPGQAPAASPAPTPHDCAACQSNPAAYLCRTHGLTLCELCRTRYTCPGEGCVWLRVAPPAPAETSRPRSVVTSPLGRIR